MSIIAIVVIVLLALAVVGAVVAWQLRRRATLRSRFGPEYDRTLETAPDRRSAERDLRDRARRHDELDIRPLSPAAAERYGSEWQLVQQRFVDAPAESVAHAHSLVSTVMAERGYPTGSDDDGAAMLSVDHADVMDRYRVAQRTEAAWRASGTTDTEELRQAMQHFRTVFERLVDTGSEPYPGNADPSRVDTTS